MTIKEVIKNRKSCRTYNQEHLTPGDKKTIEEFINLNCKGVFNNSSEGDGICTLAGDRTINLFILEKGDVNKKLKLDYGVIQGNHTYILGIAESTPEARLNYGYLMEKVVLKSTELGLATCWIGYFDHEYFDYLKIKEGFKIPGIVIIGYPAHKTTLPARFLRFTANASQRLPWEKLFFDFQSKAPLFTGKEINSSDRTLTTNNLSSDALQIIKDYSESLEMVRLAPSSSNTQPWRIFFDGLTNEFHFFKKPKNRIYESMGMHELDMGIAMAHFEMTSQENGLKGNWTCHKTDGASTSEARFMIPVEVDLQYIVSWKCLDEHLSENLTKG